MPLLLPPSTLPRVLAQLDYNLTFQAAVGANAQVLIPGTELTIAFGSLPVVLEAEMQVTAAANNLYPGLCIMDVTSGTVFLRGDFEQNSTANLQAWMRPRTKPQVYAPGTVRTYQLAIWSVLTGGTVSAVGAGDFGQNSGTFRAVEFVS